MARGAAAKSDTRQARIRSISAHLIRRHGGRVQRVLVRGGFGCPNRDGRAGYGGCTFCDFTATWAARTDERPGVAAQIADGIARIGPRSGARRFLAYFHDGSATDAPVARLAALYREALAQPGVVGLAVGTRPDCLPDTVLDLLADLNRRAELWLEIGLQSACDATLQRVNRGHDVRCFEDAVRRAHERGLAICAHVVLGLPGEDRSHARATAELLTRLSVEGVKLHNFHVLTGARCADDFRAGRIRVPGLSEYALLAADFLERIPPVVVIHRLAASARSERLVAPDWTADRWAGRQAVLDELEHRDSWQGSTLGADAGDVLRSLEGGEPC